MNKPGTFIIVVVLLAICSCSLLTTGSISGKVIDSKGGAPISAASVSTDPPTSAVTTDAQGNYFIPNVPAGKYTVTAVKSGYQSSSVKVAVVASITTTADVPLPPALTNAPIQPTGESASSELVAYWSFDDGTPQDQSGNGHHGTVYGATLTEDRHGNPRRAYYFNGENSFIKVPHAPGLADLGSQMSIAAWIKIDSNTSYKIYDQRHILSKGATYGVLWADYALVLSNPAGALGWEYSGSDNSPFRMDTGLPVAQGGWHHVVATFDGQTIRLYVDAELQKTLPGRYKTIRSSSQPLYIGCRYENPIVGVFKGAIDEVRIYNYALFEADIQELYQAQ